MSCRLSLQAERETGNQLLTSLSPETSAAFSSVPSNIKYTVIEKQQIFTVTTHYVNKYRDIVNRGHWSQFSQN